MPEERQGKPHKHPSDNRNVQRTKENGHGEKGNGYQVSYDQEVPMLRVWARGKRAGEYPASVLQGDQPSDSGSHACGFQEHDQSQ
jgi:hypothetical protein